ncbi:flagellar biosynthesis protein FlhF [Simiduia sp. 21SJ11W-1]|uniref:flagellar biosynthesis protein FlhF n=1 Tax=Simiduia sp. 21SJ11W-1 TaxID=2909669 RepID=UPI00209F754D|nr:flagellar biosynthesis protein FlhF [Simiduia sp. 21SJ11W-1]UTA49501.1 flagellar biosynthesis protein FlhF [Simiduia sp. 21SJ11W-1]
MAIKKIVAANMRRALDIAREQLGPDAIILSTRRHPDGIELMATVEAEGRVPDDQQAFAAQKAEAEAAFPLNSDNAWQHQDAVSDALAHSAQTTQHAALPQSNPRPKDISQKLFGGKTGPELAAEIEAARQRMLANQAREAPQRAGASSNVGADDVWASQLTREQARKATPDKPQYTAQPSAKSGVAPNAEPTPAQTLQANEMARLHAELSEMRTLLKQQLDQSNRAGSLSNNPVVHKLAGLGLPAFQCERIAAAVDGDHAPDKAWAEALALLSQRLPTAGRDVVANGGVYAFVGPTGVGKTTTLAKLAVRHVLAHGPQSLALVTTDNFRLAAHEQITSLGRLLKVPVKVVGEGESLEQILVNLSHKRLVLIDTAGLRHGDPRLKQQLAQLREAGKVNSLLVLAANSQAQMLKASCHAYGAAHPVATVLTKLDETPSLGEAMGMLLAHRLPLAYTTDGQEIPADIQVAKGHQLVAKAAKNPVPVGSYGVGVQAAKAGLQVQAEQL